MGSFSGRGCWRGPASPGFRPPAFKCSTGPGPQAVFEDSVHMMFAELPDRTHIWPGRST
jgi:hypothetical protein